MMPLTASSLCDQPPNLTSCARICSSVAEKRARRSCSCATTSGGALANKTLIGEFGARLVGFRIEPCDFLGQAFAFGRHVDFHFEHQLEISDDGYRCVFGRQFVDDQDFGKACQRHQVRRKAAQLGCITLRQQRQFLRRGDVHFTAQRAAG